MLQLRAVWFDRSSFGARTGDDGKETDWLFASAKDSYGRIEACQRDRCACRLKATYAVVGEKQRRFGRGGEVGKGDRARWRRQGLRVLHPGGEGLCVTLS